MPHPYYRCSYRTDTAAERLSNARWAAKMTHDHYAGVRARTEAIYTRLVRIGRGPGPVKRSNYAGTRGSGYNAETRADILAHAYDDRRLYTVRRANGIK